MEIWVNRTGDPYYNPRAKLASLRQINFGLPYSTNVTTEIPSDQHTLMTQNVFNPYGAQIFAQRTTPADQHAHPYYSYRDEIHKIPNRHFPSQRRFANHYPTQQGMKGKFQTIYPAEA